MMATIRQMLTEYYQCTSYTYSESIPTNAYMYVCHYKFVFEHVVYHKIINTQAIGCVSYIHVVYHREGLENTTMSTNMVDIGSSSVCCFNLLH